MSASDGYEITLKGIKAKFFSADGKPDVRKKLHMSRNVVCTK
jgi:hypothetical protein